MSLDELLRHIEAATGPDRSLDGEIAHAFGETVHGVGMPLRYTASLDCALALVERCLPEANALGVEKELGGWNAYVALNFVPRGHWLHEASAKPTPALALLSALLRALLSQEKGE